MILYFADRQLNILGQASTELPHGLTVIDDWKTDDIETGVAVFECIIPFEDDTRKLVENCTKSGNYILRNYDGANEFYTITEREIDTKRQEVSIYAEDAGLDLLNEIVEAYEADKAYPISFYIEKFAYDSGFEIGVNEAASLTRKLSWDGESTAAERIASVANRFDGCEISFSFAIKGLEITHKYINIYKERGKDIGANLRLNEDIDKIVTKESIINLATALKCTGGTPDVSTDILETTSDEGTPQVKYEVSLETLSRTAKTAEISASVSASLVGEDSVLGKGYVLTASLYMGGEWHDVALKETADEWKNTTWHTKETTFTVAVPSAAEFTFTDIKFKVTRSDSKGGTAGILGEKVCGKYILTNYIEGGENGEGIADRPMTLEGYTYDDGNFYVDGTYLKSREALKIWSRYSWTKEPNQAENGSGHIVKLFSYDTLSQSELCAQALAELKKACEKEINYEVDINKLPDNIKVGDRINIIDDSGELYVSARILKLDVSVFNDEHKATLGEYLIRSSGISAKVEEMAAEFAATAAANRKAKEEALKAAKQAEAEALAAKAAADNAQSTADNAQTNVVSAEAAAQQLADSLATLIVDDKGTALMQNVDNKWVFNIGQIESNIAETARDVSGVKTDLSHTKAALANLNQSLDDLGIIANFVRVDTSGSEPVIELGTSANDYTVRITNTEIQFADGSIIPTRITRQMMLIEKALIRLELQFGDDTESGVNGVWIMKRRTSGNLGISWKGVSG